MIPNFLVVGAAKTGTTSMYRYLSQHPEVYRPPGLKGSFFFVREAPLGGVTGPDYGSHRDREWCDYKVLFNDATSQFQATAEVCVAYLFFYELAIQEIKKYLGEPRILILLRDPVERAFSNYLHHVRDGHETESFERALELEGKRASLSYWWGYRLKEVSLYSRQVSAYIAAFPKTKILFYDDMVKDSATFMLNIYQFLGVKSSFQPDLSRRYNVSEVPRFKLQRQMLNNDPMLKRTAKVLLPQSLRSSLHSTLSGTLTRKPTVNPHTEKVLRQFFTPDIKRLETLVGRDLTAWKTDE